MDSIERDFITYNLLSEVFIDNTYASLCLSNGLKKLDDEKDKTYISNLFYGVIEKNLQLEYIIRQLTEKKPKASIAIIIKIGLYRLRFTDAPPYAAINTAVELAKRVGKTGVSGFINAILRNSQSVELPKEGDLNDAEFLSVNYGIPLWICKKLINEYGYKFTKDFFEYKPIKKTHIRYNSRVIKKDDFENKIEKFGFEQSMLGYYVTHNVLSMPEKSLFAPQSLSSMIAVNCYLDDKKDPTVLDLCGAPGGKSIYLEELVPKAKIYCCDVYPHRVELIKKYAARMGSNIIPVLSDATKIMPEWIDKFDMVICDVPCTGLGVYKNKPDILFNKKESDVKKIVSLQSEILENAKNYVKVGGLLCYSTCTVLKEENDGVIDEFLNKNTSFRLEKSNSTYAGENDGKIRLFPFNSGCDGFFVARMRRRA